MSRWRATSPQRTACGWPDRNSARRACGNLFGRAAPLDHAEVLMMQRYDPQRLTVALIHGLAASPDSWVNVANEIMGDPRLREPLSDLAGLLSDQRSGCHQPARCAQGTRNRPSRRSIRGM